MRYAMRVHCASAAKTSPGSNSEAKRSSATEVASVKPETPPVGALWEQGGDNSVGSNIAEDSNAAQPIAAVMHSVLVTNSFF